MPSSSSRRTPARSTSSPRRAAPARSPGPARRSTSSRRGRRLPVALLIGITLAVSLIAVIVVTVGAGGTGGGPLEVGTPAVTGQALSRFVSADGDPAVGQPIPEAAGTDFQGATVTITRDGRAKVIMFVAHWCSVCRREVPAVVDWLTGAQIPDNVDLYLVSTGVDRGSENYPPSRWLEEEGWTLPVIMDGQSNPVADAFGLSAYPYFVFAGTDGNVVARLTGALSPATLDALVAEVAGS